MFSALPFVILAALPSAATFLTTLLLIRGMGLEPFAGWAVVEPVIGFSAVLGTLGTQYGVLFLSSGQGPSESSALGPALVVTAVGAVAAGILGHLLARAMGIDTSALLLCAVILAESLVLVVVASLRGQRRTGVWLLLEFARNGGFVLLIGLAMLLRGSEPLDVNSVLAMKAAATWPAILLCVAKLRPWPIRLTGSFRAIKYGGPMLIAALLSLAAVSADRWLLAWLHAPPAIISAYTVHLRIVGLMSVVTVAPINLWFAAEAIRRDRQQDTQFFSDALYATLLLLSLVMGAACVFIEPLWMILFGSIEIDRAILCLLASGVAVQTIGIVVNIGGLREGRTGLNIIAALASLFTVAILGALMVRSAGGLGAAAARAGAALVLTAVAMVFSQKLLRIYYDLRTVMLLFGAIIAPWAFFLLTWPVVVGGAISMMLSMVAAITNKRILTTIHGILTRNQA